MDTGWLPRGRLPPAWGGSPSSTVRLGAGSWPPPTAPPSPSAMPRSSTHPWISLSPPGGGGAWVESCDGTAISVSIANPRFAFLLVYCSQGFGCRERCCTRSQFPVPTIQHDLLSTPPRLAKIPIAPPHPPGDGPAGGAGGAAGQRGGGPRGRGPRPGRRTHRRDVRRHGVGGRGAGWSTGIHAPASEGSGEGRDVMTTDRKDLGTTGHSGW